MKTDWYETMPNLEEFETGVKVTKASSGFAVLLGFGVVLFSVTWFAHSHHASIPEDAALPLICFAFGWFYLGLWKIIRGCRKLGWNRSNFAKFLADPRSKDPDELLIWRWTVQLCHAILAVVLCVLAFAFTP